MNISFDTAAFYDRPAAEVEAAVSTEDLAQMLIDAKAIEDGAVKRRRTLEALLAARFKKIEEGSFTAKIEGFKVKVDYPIHRKVDFALLDAISADALPEEMRPVKTVRELDVKQMRNLQNNEPEMYRLFAAAMTATPGKVSVKVEYLDE